MAANQEQAVTLDGQTSAGPDVRNVTHRAAITHSSCGQTAKVLQLPEEIQMEILSYVLVEPRYPLNYHSYIHNHAPPPSAPTSPTSAESVVRPKDDPQPTISLAVLSVCKGWYFLGIEAFYGSNTFYFNAPKHLSWFVQPLGSDRRRHVKHLVVFLAWSLNYLGRVREPGILDTEEAVELLVATLGSLPGLESVRICTEGGIGPGGIVPERIPAMVRGAWGGKADVLQFGPRDDQVRTWTFRIGTHKVEAAFILLSCGRLQLFLTSGVKMTVSFHILSRADVEYVYRITDVHPDFRKDFGDGPLATCVF